MTASDAKSARLVWTNTDEMKLVELTERKARAMTQNREPLLKLAKAAQLQAICDGLGDGQPEEFFVDWLIANADDLRDALQPFDSGTRPPGLART